MAYQPVFGNAFSRWRVVSVPMNAPKVPSAELAGSPSGVWLMRLMVLSATESSVRDYAIGAGLVFSGAGLLDSLKLPQLDKGASKTVPVLFQDALESIESRLGETFGHHVIDVAALAVERFGVVGVVDDHVADRDDVIAVLSVGKFGRVNR